MLNKSKDLEIYKMAALEVKIKINLHGRELQTEEIEYFTKIFNKIVAGDCAMDKFPPSVYHSIMSYVIGKDYSKDAGMFDKMITLYKATYNPMFLNVAKFNKKIVYQLVPSIISNQFQTAHVLKLLLILAHKCQKKLLKFLMSSEFENWFRQNEKSRFNIIRKFLSQFQLKDKHFEL